MNLLYFKDWVKPYEKRCKDRGVKFTNKNRKKLFDTGYIRYCQKHKGQLNGLFFAIYADKINNLIPDINTLFKVPKLDTEIWTSPTIISFPQPKKDVDK